jgi:hypothetical protein
MCRQALRSPAALPVSNCDRLACETLNMRLTGFIILLFQVPKVRGANGGPNGGRLREIDVVLPPLIPLWYPADVLSVSGQGNSARNAKDTRNFKIEEVHWARIRQSSRDEGLRDIARDYGVRHETIRAVAQRTKL